MFPIRSLLDLRAGARVVSNQGINFRSGSPAGITELLYNDTSAGLCWYGHVLAYDDEVVHRFGDETITGIKTYGDGLSSAIVEFNKSASGSVMFSWQTAGIDRHAIVVRDQELGVNSGANFYFACYNDAGTLIDYPLQWLRAPNGLITIGGINRPTYFTHYVGFGTNTPHSQCHINGSKANKITITTVNLTLDDSHNTIYCNNTTNIDVNLPGLTTIDGREYTIIKGNTGFVGILDDSGRHLHSLMYVGESITLTVCNEGWSVKSRNQPIVEGRYKWEEHAEFLNLLNGSSFTATVSGTGATLAQVAAPSSSHPGVIQLSTGTTATGYASAATNLTAIQLGNGIHTFETLIQIPILSVASQEFDVRVGFLDSYSGLPIDGVYFEYDRQSSTSWRFSSSSNSTRTNNVAPVTVTAGSWYKLKIVILDNPSLAAFYINNVLVGTITTNLPTGAGRQVGHAIHIAKSNGTTARTVQVDYISIAQYFSASR